MARHPRGAGHPGPTTKGSFDQPPKGLSGSCGVAPKSGMVGAKPVAQIIRHRSNTPVMIVLTGASGQGFPLRHAARRASGNGPGVPRRAASGTASPFPHFRRSDACRFRGGGLHQASRLAGAETAPSTRTGHPAGMSAACAAGREKRRAGAVRRGGLSGRRPARPCGAAPFRRSRAPRPGGPPPPALADVLARFRDAGQRMPSPPWRTRPTLIQRRSGGWLPAGPARPPSGSPTRPSRQLSYGRSSSMPGRLFRVEARPEGCPCPFYHPAPERWP